MVLLNFTFTYIAIVMSRLKKYNCRHHGYSWYHSRLNQSNGEFYDFNIRVNTLKSGIEYTLHVTLSLSFNNNNLFIHFIQYKRKLEYIKKKYWLKLSSRTRANFALLPRTTTPARRCAPMVSTTILRQSGLPTLAVIQWTHLARVVVFLVCIPIG